MVLLKSACCDLKVSMCAYQQELYFIPVEGVFYRWNHSEIIFSV